MSNRRREDKKNRKEIRRFFASKAGKELSYYVRQNGILKIALAVAAMVVAAEAVIIWRMI